MSVDSDGPVKLELPEQWLWDIIDEFIYQYQVFCSWRSKVKNKTEDELVMLGEGGPVCLVSCSSVPLSKVDDDRSGVHTVYSMFYIPWCKNPRLTSTSSPREREKHPKKLRAWYLVPAFGSQLTFSLREIVGEYGQRSLYRMLGYFSIVGLLRVHVLLGDFTLALKVMENVELNQKVGI